ncbi:MAG: hypothetical protein ACPGYL_12200, partial [Rhodospirillaceae bacterium]
MSSDKFDPSEQEALDKLLLRVGTHFPPDKVDLEKIHAAWPNQAGKAYIEAFYHPRPVAMLLGEDIIIRKQWFLVTVPHVVKEEDAIDLLTRAVKKAPYKTAYGIVEQNDFFGVSRRGPTRLAGFVRDRLVPLLKATPLQVTADLLLAVLAVQDAKGEGGGWLPPFTVTEQRHAIEVELVLASEAGADFTWQKDHAGRLLFSSGAIVQAEAAPEADKPKGKAKGKAKAKDGEKDKEKEKAAEAELAALAKKLKAAQAEISALKKEADAQAARAKAAEAAHKEPLSDRGLPERLRKVYRKHVIAYHPDKMSGRSDQDKAVADEVVRVL